MGVLETRNLDFDHVLLLSTNEGNLPRGITDSSFIPYSLRRAFGLTTADHKAAIYAYYFNRLLSRATDVTIVYNNATTDGQTAEMSRFVLQLLVEDNYHTIVRRILQAGQSLASTTRQPATFEKSPEVLNALRERFSASILSPTAINRYMRCPLQFYYCYVEGLREPDDTEDGVIDNRIFGNIFHNAAQLLYERLMQKSNHILASDLENLLKQNVDIERAVDEAFHREFREHVPTGGLAVINREVIVHYLRQLVEVDRQLAPFTILKLEKDVLHQISLPTLGIKITLGGRVDRLDCITTADGRQQIRVIDYKTSAGRLRPLKDVDDIFDGNHLSNHSDYYLQALLYARIYSRTINDCAVAPALLFIQHAGTDDYNPILKFGSSYINDIATPDGDRFVHLLMEKINEIFNPELPFIPTAENDRCKTCPYVQLCKG
jgi:CRISPR/Cas system-associated exonuclease Cas4 (RecB family)